MKNVTIARIAGIAIGFTMALSLTYFLCVSRTNEGIAVKWDGIVWVAFIATITGAFCGEHVNRFLNKRQNRSGK